MQFCPLRPLSVVAVSALVFTVVVHAQPDKHLIRLKFEQGQHLTYSFEIDSKLEHTPRKAGLSWFDGNSDIDFVLKAKTPRDHGGGTYEFLGDKLKGKLRNSKGSLRFDADERRMKLRVKGRSVWVDTPFKNEMTVTVGPRFAIHGGTGLGPIYPYFSMPVGRVFWHLLATAPQDEVGIGDKWDVDFAVHLPDSKGEPLNVKARAQVNRWRTVSNRKCLEIALAAQLKLEDTTVTLRNGDKLRVKDGLYEAAGKAHWDVKRGMLVQIEAESSLDIRSTKQRLQAAGKAKLRLTSDR